MFSGISSRSGKKKSIWREYAQTFAIAALVSTFARLFVVEAFKLTLQDKVLHNNPTLNHGQRVLTNKLYYFFLTPARGDLVAAKVDAQRRHIIGRFFGASIILRIVGLPGDHIVAKDGRVICDGVMLAEPYVVYSEVMDEGIRFDKVLEGYLLLGDNRTKDAFQQPCHVMEVPRENIKGRVFFIYSFWRRRKNDRKVFGFLKRPEYNIEGDSKWLHTLSSPKFQKFFKL